MAVNDNVDFILFKAAHIDLGLHRYGRTEKDIRYFCGQHGPSPAIGQGRTADLFGQILIILVHAGMGNQVEALKWLEKALDEKSHWLIWLKLDPRWTRLREEPRFQALVKKVGLDP